MQFRGMVDQLIHRQGDKVDEHDLDNGSEPRRCRADSETHDRAFADRRVDHPIRAKLFSESFSDAEGAAEGDVFAEDVNG